ncbi:TPA: hypothetical protein DDW35_06165 [Candidatus Sumerlaeota bacterium]|jgi:glucosylceramidase|nr:hypothetical protein [Candidatus Sumerlaeota bacterium]
MINFLRGNQVFGKPETTDRQPKNRLRLWAAVCAFAGVLGVANVFAGGVTWISSTPEEPWKTEAAPELIVSNPKTPATVRVVSDKSFQTMEGFGACFTELSWAALGKATQEDRDKVLQALFSNDGCAFTLGRIPIGANDFALDWYSLDETPGDLALRDFSIERDKKNLIPFIKAAMAIRPELKCFGSPWSPPSWMKENKTYNGGVLKWEPEILRCYATYLARWAEEYRKAGVNVIAIAPQNEPNILSAYPSCKWTGERLRDFIADYLGPELKKRKTKVDIWLGTLNLDLGSDSVNDRLLTVMESPKASALIKAVCFQYDSKKQIGSVSLTYPDKKIMQSETECNSGKNSWDDAQRLYGLMKYYLDNNTNGYFAWNMVLNETGMSTWKWRQNALITVDQNSGKVTMNGEYYVMRHFSQFVKPGAKRVLSSGSWNDRVAFVNPDKSTVVVISNPANQVQPFVLTVPGYGKADTISVKVAAHSVNTFVLKP